MSDKKEIQDFLITYIKDHIADETVSVDENTNFVTTRLLDSFSILSMIMTLESEFAVKFTPQELSNADLQVVANMADTILEKKA
ncbi:acyl carrier protein [Terasakiella sp. SH-1]|uniref:acyl carrier protein n=1 Tax=Terasakiella sp. SH-1 TaxID=2560057 RepID=UPI001073AF65|nr:acyl carrier protein [Terasakiella sp. SH-1]